MYINGNIAVTYVNGKFFDLFDTVNYILGTDYSCLDREILINNNAIEIGGKKKRMQAVSINDLRSALKSFCQQRIKYMVNIKYILILEN